MSDIVKLRNQLVARKGHCTREANKVKDELSSVSVNTRTLASAIQRLEGKYASYQNTFEDLDLLLVESCDPSRDRDTSNFEAYDQEISALIKRAYQACDDKENEDLRVKQAIKLTTSNPTNNQIKLPSVEPIKFSGDLDKWSTFWSNFEALVHNNQNLTPSIKFTHLQRCLTGEAYEIVRHFPCDDASYTTAIQRLKSEYDNPKALEEKLIDKLLDLDPAKYTVASLNSFVNTYASVLSSIEATQPELMKAECLIKRIIGRKLPKEVRAYLELKHKKIYFSLEEISDGIHDCIKKLRTNDEDENPESLSFEEKNLQTRLSSKKKFISVDPSHSTSHKSKTNLPSKAKLSSVNRTEATVNSATSNKVPMSKDVDNQQRFPCLFCDDLTHFSSQCTQYPSLASRSDRLVSQGRCSLCVKKGHKRSDCLVKLRECKRCKTPHHYTLCPKLFEQKGNSNPNTVTSSTGTFSVKSCLESCSVALPTATARLSSSNKCLTERVFFDQGSQCTIISTGLSQRLNLEPIQKRDMAVSGLLKDSDLAAYDIVKLSITIGRYKKDILAVVMDRAVASINVPGLCATYQMLKQKNLKLADHDITQDLLTGIGLTIGADYYGEFVRGGKEKRYGIYLTQTPGGYMIYGPIGQKQILSASAVISNRVATNLLVQESFKSQEAVELFKEVPKLWELDVIGIDPKARKPEDDMTFKNYIQSVKYENNQYWVRLPWKPDHPHLPTNFRMAMGQVQSLRHSLEEKGDLDNYDKLIHSQLEADFIEIVPDSAPKDGESHYLPHHGVKKDSVTTPLRMVFNCSAKTGGNPSLNDCLLTGPSLTTKLGDALLEFRTQKYGVVGDISKAFLRIGLQTCDRDFTRFLWYSDPHDPNSPLVTYRFKSVLFGATCSPFLLEATLEIHLQQSSSRFKDKLRKGLYVDNLQVVTSTTDELHSIYEDANETMARANMPLRMWVSNNDSLTERIKNDFPDQPELPETNILGITWYPSSDTISVKAPTFEQRDVLSKRQLLSHISATFDPLGLLTPITIRGKMLMQEAWKLKIDWDVALPQSFVTDWQEIQDNLLQINNVQFPRSVVNDEDCILHVFCDASQHAYGACAYLTSSARSHLLTSKGRVSPVNNRSLPELELTAIQVGTQLAHYIKDLLKSVKITAIYIWSDNESALQWIRNDRSDTPYVKNRTAKIRDLSDGYTFLHIGTKVNPADLISRGVDVDTLVKDDMWFHGPPWLTDQTLWPQQKANVICVQTVTIQPYEYLFDCSKLQPMSKVIRITEYVLNFVNKLLAKKGKKCFFKNGLHYWLYSVQQGEFPEELIVLKNNRSPKKFSLISNLGLYIDQSDHLIHCRGRIEKSNSVAAKYPILLSRRHPFSKHLIVRIHSQVMHGGTADTLAQLRETYWLPKGRQIIKQALSKCYTCRYLMSKAYPYPGPPVLPECRVNLTIPFKTIGVDYSGNININTGDEVSKYYFCIFTCATTRAVHLELARDMTAETFLHLLRRFIARRSLPSLIISDNGKYFSANALFLKKLQEEPLVREFLQDRSIDWKFIPPRSPWMGGFYERLVGVVKRTLKLSLFRRHVTEDELHTLLAEVEQKVNNRPLTYIEDDINNPVPLTPAHLIYGRRLESFPSVITCDTEDPSYAEHDELNQLYNYHNKILSHWEKVWSKEYIASLREKFYGASPAEQSYSPSVGDVIIISSEGNRAKWPLGRITKLYPDEHGIVRTVEVYTKGNHFMKTINKLIPLECALDKDCGGAEPADEALPVEEVDSLQVQDPPKVRPKRRAAAKADAQRLQLLADDQL